MDFESKVKETIKKYKLANKKDKIIVAMSGGKDSTTVAYLLNKLGFKIEALHINLLMGKWSNKNLENVREFCKELKIKLHVYSIRDIVGYAMCYVKSVLKEKEKLRQCTVCGIIRRWIINKKARELKATRVATGHNLDDEAQNVLMNFISGNPELGINLGPVTGSIKDKKFILRIKPLYFLKEKEVEKYSKKMRFPVLYQRCPCVFGALRHKTRNKLDDLEKKNPKVKENLVKNFLKIKEKMRKSLKIKELKYCKACGEPSRQEMCKACRMLKVIKK
ncbi:MAG: adenine nucleotide alpha hydrolase family protein [archaeon]|nr:MAG: adenine nucleotide alpha hydrolase family protein [archaeon]